MRFNLIANTHPSDYSCEAALKTSRAILAQGHYITQIFLYGDAVLLGALSQFGRHSGTVSSQWEELIKDEKIDAILCSNSAKAHGITPENKRSCYSVAGLAMLSEPLSTRDITLTFKPSGH